MRGQIGSSSIDSRVVKAKLLQTKDLAESKNEQVRKLMIKVKRDHQKIWNKELNECMEREG